MRVMVCVCGLVQQEMSCVCPDCGDYNYIPNQVGEPIRHTPRRLSFEITLEVTARDPADWRVLQSSLTGDSYDSLEDMLQHQIERNLDQIFKNITLKSMQIKETDQNE